MNKNLGVLSSLYFGAIHAQNFKQGILAFGGMSRQYRAGRIREVRDIF